MSLMLVSRKRFSAKTSAAAATWSPRVRRPRAVTGSPAGALMGSRPLEAARRGLDGLAPGEHPRHVQFGRAPLDGVGERELDVRPVDEAVGDDLLDRVRFTEVVEHRLVPAADDGVEVVEHLDERISP